MKDTSPAPRRASLFSKQIAKTLEPVLKPIYHKHGFAEHRILTEWHTIVGQELSSCSIPQKLTVAKQNRSQSTDDDISLKGKKSYQTGGTLHILVASGRALEMQHMIPVIIDKIAAYFGYNAVSKITFTQTNSAAFRKKKPEKPQKMSQISKTATLVTDNCMDEELRKVLLALGNALEDR